MSRRGELGAAARRARSNERLRRRYRRERVFRGLCLASVLLAGAFLLVILGSLLRQGASAFTQTHILLPLDEMTLAGGAPDPGAIDYDREVLDALAALLAVDPDRAERRELRQLVSIDAAFVLRRHVESSPARIAQDAHVRVPASAKVDMAIKGEFDRTADGGRRPLSDRQVDWIDRLVERGAVERIFNTALFTNGDSREPELAGIRAALTGSVFMLLTTLAVAFPIGVAAAVYLEEFAPRRAWVRFLELNINNLAAVPSIVFGLLGLVVLIDWLSMPRSAPLVGGLVLALLTLPVIVISSRSAIRAVPMSIREASLGLGASRMQVVSHHVLPQAMPGIVTGTIIGLSRALGETAPLLMIGMVAFIVDVPEGVTDPATALPVQIYLWADSPERAFAERTSAAILVLLGFLLLMNLLAAAIRRKVER